jgi:hypothetical protein
MYNVSNSGYSLKDLNSTPAVCIMCGNSGYSIKDLTSTPAVCIMCGNSGYSISLDLFCRRERWPEVTVNLEGTLESATRNKAHADVRVYMQHLFTEVD